MHSSWQELTSSALCVLRPFSYCALPIYRFAQAGGGSAGASERVASLDRPSSQAPFSLLSQQFGIGIQVKERTRAWHILQSEFTFVVMLPEIVKEFENVCC